MKQGAPDRHAGRKKVDDFALRLIRLNPFCERRIGCCQIDLHPVVGHVLRGGGPGRSGVLADLRGQVEQRQDYTCGPDYLPNGAQRLPICVHKLFDDWWLIVG